MTQHDYFDALVSRPDHHCSASLRDAAQLRSQLVGGYAQGNLAAILYITVDTAIEAARIRIEPFYPWSLVTAPIALDDTVITYANDAQKLPPNRILRVGDEVMTVLDSPSPTSSTVRRGDVGTTAVAHATGAILRLAGNSLRNQLRIPIGTRDGHTYLFVWEYRWTRSYLNVTKFNHKLLQFSSGGRDGDTIWLELDATFGDDGSACYDPSVHVATFHCRAQNKQGGPAEWAQSDGSYLGPGVKPNPLGAPIVSDGQSLRAPYCLFPETWTRFFVHVTQRAGDYDLVNAWIADETRDAVQVLFNVPMSVLPSGLTPNSINMTWLECNSSDDSLVRGTSPANLNRDFISHARNFVALIDPGDVTPLLLRPLAGVPVPPDPTDPPDPPGTPRPDMLKNPREITFLHDDRGITTGYKVLVFKDVVPLGATPVDTYLPGLGTVNDKGEVVLRVNVQPLAVDTYRLVVVALSQAIESDPSVASEAWQRAPGKPGTLSVA